MAAHAGPPRQPGGPVGPASPLPMPPPPPAFVALLLLVAVSGVLVLTGVQVWDWRRLDDHIAATPPPPPPSLADNGTTAGNGSCVPTVRHLDDGRSVLVTVCNAIVLPPTGIAAGNLCPTNGSYFITNGGVGADGRLAS